MSVNIFDYSSKDGGHYRNWDFDSETIIKYLAAVAATKINLIEIRC
jgi:hypothetical protein